MPADNDDTNTLYMIVGGLLVVALLFGFVVYGRYNNPANIEPAAGTTTYSSTTINQSAPAESDMEDETQDQSPATAPPGPESEPARQ